MEDVAWVPSVSEEKKKVAYKQLNTETERIKTGGEQTIFFRTETFEEDGETGGVGTATLGLAGEVEACR